VQFFYILAVLLLVLRFIYMFVDIFRHRLVKRYRFLRHMPQSAIVKSPVRKVANLCDEEVQQDDDRGEA